MEESKINKSFSEWKIPFFIFTILVNVILVILSSCNHSNYSKEQDAILQSFTKSLVLTDSVVKSDVMILEDDTLYTINNSILEELNRRESNIETLLSMHFDRLQSEQSTLEIWTALITIVFLIFSFYSILHTDELIKEAKSGVNKIKEEFGKANIISESLKVQLEGIYNPIKEKIEKAGKDSKKIDDFQSNYKNLLDSQTKNESDLKILNDNISGQSQQLKDYKDQLSTLSLSLDDYKKSINKENLDSKIKEILDKIQKIETSISSICDEIQDLRPDEANESYEDEGINEEEQ